jgi:hypothetical protein
MKIGRKKLRGLIYESIKKIQLSEQASETLLWYGGPNHEEGSRLSIDAISELIRSDSDGRGGTTNRHVVYDTDSEGWVVWSRHAQLSDIFEQEQSGEYDVRQRTQGTYERRPTGATRTEAFWPHNPDEVVTTDNGSSVEAMGRRRIRGSMQSSSGERSHAFSEDQRRAMELARAFAERKIKQHLGLERSDELPNPTNVIESDIIRYRSSDDDTEYDMQYVIVKMRLNDQEDEDDSQSGQSQQTTPPSDDTDSSTGEGGEQHTDVNRITPGSSSPMVVDVSGNISQIFIDRSRRLKFAIPNSQDSELRSGLTYSIKGQRWTGSRWGMQINISVNSVVRSGGTITARLYATPIGEIPVDLTAEYMDEISRNVIEKSREFELEGDVEQDNGSTQRVKLTFTLVS